MGRRALITAALLALAAPAFAGAGASGRAGAAAVRAAAVRAAASLPAGSGQAARGYDTSGVRRPDVGDDVYPRAGRRGSPDLLHAQVGRGHGRPHTPEGARLRR